MCIHTYTVNYLAVHVQLYLNILLINDDFAEEKHPNHYLIHLKCLLFYTKYSISLLALLLIRYLQFSKFVKGFRFLIHLAIK